MLGSQDDVASGLPKFAEKPTANQVVGEVTTVDVFRNSHLQFLFPTVMPLSHNDPSTSN